MKKYDCVIILHSNVSYLDVCKNFLELYKKYWGTCNYPLVVSLLGEKKEEINCSNLLYNSKKNTTLPECILNVVEKYDAKYYCCLLGDALMTKEYNKNIFETILVDMKEKGIEYCSLKPTVALYKKSTCGKYCRYINQHDRYSVNYGAFIATKKFVLDEFGKKESDYDFESKYVRIAEMPGKYDYYHDKLIVKKDFLGIQSGIANGMWIRKVYKKLLHDNPELILADRPLLSRKATFVLYIRAKLERLLSPKMLYFLKKITYKVGLLK